MKQGVEWRLDPGAWLKVAPFRLHRIIAAIAANGSSFHVALNSESRLDISYIQPPGLGRIYCIPLLGTCFSDSQS